MFDRDGAPVGVQAFQEAASGAGRGGLFLLPANIVNATIKQAAESAKQVLAEEGSSEKTPAKDETGESKPKDDDDNGKKTEDNDPGKDDDGDK